MRALSVGRGDAPRVPVAGLALAAVFAHASPAAAQPEVSERLRLQAGYIHLSNQTPPDDAPDDASIGVVPEVSLLVPWQRTKLRLTYALAATTHTSFGTDVSNRLSAVSQFDLSNRSMLLVSGEANETSFTNELVARSAAGPPLAAVPTSNSKLVAVHLATAATWEATPVLRAGAAVDGTFVEILNDTPVVNYLANVAFDLDRSWKNDILGLDVRGGYSHAHLPPTPDQQIFAFALAPQWKRDISDELTSSIRAGAALVVSPDSSTRALVAPSALASLLYIRDAANFELSAAVGPQSNAVTAQLLNAEQISLRAVVPVSARYHVVAGASAGALHGEILNLRYDVPSQLPFNALLASADVGWSPTETVQLFARYQLLDQITSAPPPTTTPAALRNIMTIGVQLTTQPSTLRIPVRFPQRVDRTDVAPPP